MKIVENSKKNTIKLILAFAVLVSFSCQFSSSAEYSTQTEYSTLLSSSSPAIYLDASQIFNPNVNKNLLTPSEYRKKQAEAVKEQVPEKYSPIDNGYKELNKELPELRQSIDEQANFLPFDNMDMFAPPSEYIPQPPKINVEAPPQLFTQPEDIKQSYTDSFEEDNTVYEASAESAYGNDIADFEGKIITNINFTGLRLVSENLVKQSIQTQNGSVFNASNLQLDLQRLYSTGYFTDIMHVEPKMNEDETVTLEFIVKENVEVKEVKLIGCSVIPSTELYQFVKNLKNLPQNLNLINDSIEKINDCYHKKGYTLASVTSVDDNSDGILSFSITEGVIDKIVFNGNTKTKDFVIERNIMTQPGSVYNEEQIKRDLKKVYSTQIFEKVDKTITPSPDKDGQFVVSIDVKEASSNSVTIGGGIDNAIGVFGSLSVNENNFLGSGQQIGLSGMVGSGLLMSDASIKNRMNYQIELNFREPHFINADNSLMSKIYFRELGSYQVPLAIERRFGVNGVVTHKVKGYDNLSTNLGLGYEHIYLKEGDLNKISALYRESNVNFKERSKQLTGGDFLNIAPGVKFSTVDNEFMPRKGTVAQARFVEALGLSKLKSTNGRLMGSVTHYIPVFKKSTLSIGTKAGIKVHGSDLPEVMAFRLGGPYSIRGFRMNGVGSGDSFLMGGAELQTPIPFFDRFKYDILKNMRFAFFVDAGKVFDPTVTSKLYDRPNSAITAGIGLRVYVPGIGPISVDYGLPFTHVGRYNSKHGYFTFGTYGLYDSY